MYGSNHIDHETVHNQRHDRGEISTRRTVATKCQLGQNFQKLPHILVLKGSMYTSARCSVATTSENRILTSKYRRRGSCPIVWIRRRNLVQYPRTGSETQKPIMVI